VCAPTAVVGSADGFRAQRTAGETRETPRTAHAPVAQLAKKRRRGFLNRRRQDQAPRSAFPFLRPANARAAAGSSSVHSLGFGRECTDHTRGAYPSLPASPFPPPRPSSHLALSLPSASRSLFIPPTRCVCLFIVAFWEIPDTRVTESHTCAALCRARGRLHSHSGVASGRFSDSSETSKGGRLVVRGSGSETRVRDRTASLSF